MPGPRNDGYDDGYDTGHPPGAGGILDGIGRARDKEGRSSKMADFRLSLPLLLPKMLVERRGLLPPDDADSTSRRVTGKKSSEADSIVAPHESPKRRQYRSKARDQQKRETRTRILECALVHFSERGFEAASLRDIAADSGVTHAMIHKHFGFKEELWRAAIDLMFERQAAEVRYDDWIATDRLTADGMRQLIHRYVRYCARHPEHVRIMLQESLSDTERVEWLIDSHIKPMRAPIDQLLSRAMDEGILVDVPLTSMVYIWAAASQMIFALGDEAKRLYDLDVSEPAIVQAHAEAVCSMLIRAPLSERNPGL